jgi:hypothetical protein
MDCANRHRAWRLGWEKSEARSKIPSNSGKSSPSIVQTDTHLDCDASFPLMSSQVRRFLFIILSNTIQARWNGDHFPASQALPFELNAAVVRGISDHLPRSLCTSHRARSNHTLSSALLLDTLHARHPTPQPFSSCRLPSRRSPPACVSQMRLSERNGVASRIPGYSLRREVSE